MDELVALLGLVAGGRDADSSSRTPPPWEDDDGGIPDDDDFGVGLSSGV